MLKAFATDLTRFCRFQLLVNELFDAELGSCAKQKQRLLTVHEAHEKGCTALQMSNRLYGKVCYLAISDSD